MLNGIQNLEEVCKKIASSLKIDKYDLFGVIKEDNSASAKEGKPFGLAASHKNIVTLRVWNNNEQVGITSTSNLTNEGLNSAFEIAASSAQFCDPNIHYEFSPLCLEPLSVQNMKEEAEFVSIQNLTKAAIDSEHTILDAHPSIKSVPYNKVNQSFYEQFYFNSMGSLRHQKISSAYCYFYPLAQEENKIPRQLGHLSIAKNFESLNYLECAQIAIDKTKKHLNYKKVSSGKYTVIFSPEAFLDMIGAFSNFFNAQNVLDNKSLSTKETLNAQISSPYLNIIDSPLHEKHVGKSYFDEEGTPTSDLTILESGVLKNFIHTSSTAKIFNTKPTGHTSLGSKLTAHTHFLRIFATPHSLQDKLYSNRQDIAKQNDAPIIYVENVKALHAGINALQGSFSLPFDGFILEDDSKISIESATVAGDFLSLLKNIIYVSAEEKVTHLGICADVWVRDLSITGS